MVRETIPVEKIELGRKSGLSGNIIMKDSLKVTMNEYLPLRDVVFNTLRQGILKGELAPGERLMEVALAERLGVSRTPIREAIRKLELEGLVLMIPRKGAEVASISEKSMRDVLEVRRALEELAVELACKRITQEQREELKRAYRSFSSSIENKDLIGIAQKDEAFHDVIYHATQNQKLEQMINNLREQMYRYRLEYIKDKEQRHILVEEHKMIMDALEQQDVAAAKKAIRGHIDNQETTVLKNLKIQPK